MKNDKSRLSVIFESAIKVLEKCPNEFIIMKIRFNTSKKNKITKII